MIALGFIGPFQMVLILGIVFLFGFIPTIFPWFMVGYTILGSSLGTLMSVLVFVNGLKMGSEGGIDILITATTFLFGAVGMIIGKNVEIKKN